MNLFINSTDITTVTINQMVFSQDSDFNYTDADSALQTDVQVDIQPFQVRYDESESGGTTRITHLMFSQQYANVTSAQKSGDVSVTDGATTYDIRTVKDYVSHMESELEERT